MIPITHNDVFYLKKIIQTINQQNFYATIKTNAKIENRDKINTSVSWFYSLNCWSDNV